LKTPVVTGFHRRAAAGLVLFGLLAALHLVTGLPITAQGVETAATPQERAAFARAKTAAIAGDLIEAADQLDRFVQTYPASGYRAEALTLLGHIRLENRAYQQAIALLTEVVDKSPDSEFADRAQLDLGLAYLGAENRPKAENVLSAVATSAAAPSLRRLAYEALSRLAAEAKDLVRAVTWLMEARALASDGEEQIALEERIRDLLAKAEDPRDVEAVAAAFAGRFPADIALMRAGHLYGGSGDPFDQDRVLQAFLAAFGTHELAADARTTVEANRARVRAARYVIVAPLPYQGELQAYAKSILRGAQLAVDVERGGSDLSVVLAARDYGGDIARLGAVLDETCREARCVGILGPVLSREGAAVASRAASWKIPAISPTATGVMPQNRYVFRTAMTAKTEGAAAAQYAVEHLGLKRFVVLAPRDRYSQEVAAVFADEVARLQGRVVFSVAYESGAVDFGRDLKALKEADLKQEGVMETLPVEAGAPEALPREPVYVPGFDAAFLPGDAESVGLIAAQLRFYDIVVPLLGASGWNDRSVIKIGGKYVEDAIFPDAFFPDSQDAATQRFVKEYRARYRTTPDVFAALAYDATATLVQGLKNGATSGERLRDELTRMVGYAGVSGVIGFGADGDAQRRFSWIQIRNGRFVPAL
jgi:ABC-type branched-subunit amino acid transport system substrate-binding protein/predicted negative regulator of RcsB-dependent stress response